MESKLLKVSVNHKTFPALSGEEVCFVGRSNCGKSSLINAIAKTKKLARTASKPGKTRTINFYEIKENKNAKPLYITDLPGYGYANISKSEQEKWDKMMLDYMTKRENLKYVFVLLDSRHLPSAKDLECLNFLKDYDKKIKVVLTKKDKLSKNEFSKNKKEIEKWLNEKGFATFDIIDTSAEKKEGIENLKNAIKN